MGCQSGVRFLYATSDLLTIVQAVAWKLESSCLSH
ncbi:hypothetical protein COLO4_35195 [Corchorus olitorius]|uniref:Uncharacterized protein n=1 Tax=Corchorus olitorius TaxID=93759 RepID=A0A1R3GHX2_9ROSI|nr:hypothetical protein COLO4_35195 [Corchorus olitorius]